MGVRVFMPGGSSVLIDTVKIISRAIFDQFTAGVKF